MGRQTKADEDPFEQLAREVFERLSKMPHDRLKLELMPFEIEALEREKARRRAGN